MPEPPRFFRFRIDAYTPETMPMARLAEYMGRVATVLGETSSVHFVGLEAGSTVLASRVDPEAAPKVRERVDRTRLGNGPPEAMAAVESLNKMLREDNGKATLNEDGAEILRFPGRDAAASVTLAAFTQDSTLDGLVIRVGGTKELVPVLLQNGQLTYQCFAERGIAKRLAAHIFTDDLRLKGTGRWHVNNDGDWVLERFNIQSFEVLDSEPLTYVVNALREISGSDWEKIADPWAELDEIRNGPKETH